MGAVASRVENTQSRATENGAGSTPGPLEGGLAGWFVFLAITAICVTSGIFRLGEGALYDPDAYMHLARAEALWQGWGWWDPVFTRINPPEGHIQHWTRPLDALLLLGGALGAPFVGFETALYWWGAVLSPLLMLAALICLLWATRPLLGEARQVLTGVLFVSQAALLVTFAVGRADHNGLLLICFLAQLGLIFRLARAPGDTRLAAGAGLTAAFALWIGVEALTFIAPALAILAIGYLLAARGQAWAIAVYSATLTGASALFLFVERGPERFAAMEFDQASLAHLILFGLIALAWFAISRAHARWPWRGRALGRLSLCVLVGVPSAGLLHALAPGFVESPLSQVDGLYQEVRLVKLRELQPLFLNTGEGFSWMGQVARPALWFGLALLALPFLAFKLLRTEGARRWMWAAVALNAVFFSSLALMQIRWLPYAVASLAIPYAGLLQLVITRLEQRWAPGVARKAAAKTLVCLFAAWPLLPTLAVHASGAAAAPPRALAGFSTGTCNYAALGRFLSDPAGLGAQPLTVLAFTDNGSELLYRTPHSVLSMPNHRLQPGFSASYEILAARDHAAALARVNSAGVDLILVCADDVNARRFYAPPDEPEAETLFRRLQVGVPPAGLSELNLPGDVGPFRLYRP